VAKCPECGALIDLEEDEVEEGQSFACPDCAVDLEVVNTNPLELDVIEEEDEDEDDADALEEEEEEEEEEEGFE
jgi:alpha-aminoadipate carrier protein LysW